MSPPTLTLTAGALLDVGAPAVAFLTAPSDGAEARLLPAAAPAAAELLATLRPAGDVSDVDLDRVLAAERAKGEPGEIVTVPLDRGEAPFRLLLAGTGKGDLGALRAAGAALARRAAGRERLAVAADLSPAALGALAEGIGMGAYAFSEKSGEPATVLRSAVLVVPDPSDPVLVAALARAVAVVDAVYLARDLINTPSLEKSPEWLADQAVAVGAAVGLSVSVLAPAELAAGGFGGLTAVGQGSTRGPRLVVLSYDGRPAGSADPDHVVLVGKGITFDSGGLSLKPAGSMASMKTDMAGSAAVLGVLSALAAAGSTRRVTGLMCIAENMIGGNATRPGDVIRAYGGRTIEVLNTDAEGRLVLADGLAYAAARLAPTALVDIATLTGAISVALGRKTAGLFATSDALADALSAAAEISGERVWRMPLVEDYFAAIDSPVADLANIGRYAPVQGGSIIAGLFLREFAGGVPWAHLDIAGTGRSDSDDAELTKGGTGWGVRTLLAWLAPAAA